MIKLKDLIPEGVKIDFSPLRTKIEKMLGGANTVKSATKGPSNMMVGAQYHVGSFNIYVNFNVVHLNYPTRVYDKSTHGKIVKETEKYLTKKGYTFRKDSDKVGMSNAVVEWQLLTALGNRKNY